MKSMKFDIYYNLKSVIQSLFWHQSYPLLSKYAFPPYVVSYDAFLHLQICPVCSTKVAKDIVGHMTHQHGHLFKISYHSIYYNMYIWKSAFMELIRVAFFGGVSLTISLHTAKAQIQKGWSAPWLNSFFARKGIQRGASAGYPKQQCFQGQWNITEQCS